MTSYYITLRFRQLLRFFAFNSIQPVVGMALLAGAQVAGSALVFYKLSYAYALPVYSVLALATVMQLQNKASNDFLGRNTDKTTFFKAKLAENELIVAPFVLFLLYKQSWLYAAGVATIVVPYSWYSFSMPRPRLGQMPTPYPAHSFEFLNGFRMYFAAYITHAGVLALGIFANNYYICLLSFILLLFVMISYYGVVEEPFYIWVFRSGASSFLWQKVKTLAVNYLLTFAVFTIVTGAFYHEQFAITAWCLLLGLLGLCGSMLIKYQFYPSAFIIQLSQMIFLGLAVASALAPAAILILTAYLVFAFTRARNRLKTILQC